MSNFGYNVKPCRQFYNQKAGKLISNRFKSSSFLLKYLFVRVSVSNVFSFNLFFFAFHFVRFASKRVFFRYQVIGFLSLLVFAYTLSSFTLFIINYPTAQLLLITIFNGIYEPQILTILCHRIELKPLNRFEVLTYYSLIAVSNKIGWETILITIVFC